MMAIGSHASLYGGCQPWLISIERHNESKARRGTTKVIDCCSAADRATDPFKSTYTQEQPKVST